jgi:hypothetical protein
LDPPSNNDEVFTEYLSNISDDEEDGEEVGGEGGKGKGADKTQTSGHNSLTMLSASNTDLFRVRALPLLKRRKLDVPVKTACGQRQSDMTSWQTR